MFFLRVVDKHNFFIVNEGHFSGVVDSSTCQDPHTTRQQSTATTTNITNDDDI